MKSTFKRVLLAIAAAAVIGFGFTGCQNETETEYVDVFFDITGTWNDGYSDTVIGSKTITSSYGTHEDTTVVIRKLSDTSGYIYFQLKNNVEGFGPAPDYEPITIEDSASKWSAIYYTELTSKSVKMCDAYSYTSPYDFPETLEKCIQKYTVEDENDYFGYTPVFARKK